MADKEKLNVESGATKPKRASSRRTTKALPERTLPQAGSVPTVTGDQPERFANETF